MKKSIVCLALLTACIPRPMALTSVAPKPISETLSCAREHANKLGYAVTSLDTATKFVVAVKVTKDHNAGSAWGVTDHDVLTVFMINPDSATRSMRVIASSDEENTMLGSHQKRAKATSRQVKADAGVVLSACTNVTQ